MARGSSEKLNKHSGSHILRNLTFSVVIHAIIILSFVSTSSGFFGEWGPDLEGPWCSKRPRGEQCCTGRDDYCAVPILGTECYCDVFCNETAYDCCPDYWQYCHGYSRQTTPRPTPLPTPRPIRENSTIAVLKAATILVKTKEPITTPEPTVQELREAATCIRNGARYRPGETVKDNCNLCTCEQVPGGINTDWRCTNDPCLIRPKIIEAVNDGEYTWKASNYSQMWGLTLDEGMRYRLGTFLLEADVLRMTPISAIDDVLPEEFDARQKWPNMLSGIRDQGNCASSWAFSTAAVAEDRLRIETDGVMSDTLSVQHLVSCDTDGQNGCDGGRLDRAWWFMRKYGVVTEDCYPYRSGLTDEKGECFIAPKARGSVCPSGNRGKADRRYKATPPYRIRPVEREIMKEILNNGPVQATFLVREDFFMYNRGIYSYSALTSRRRDPEQYMKSGYHSVRIIGWGAERTERGDIIKYWNCANSWGPYWGENGYFRILRGSDESQIERYVVGVWGKVSGDSALRVLLQENRRRRLRTQGGNRQLRNLVTRRRRRRRMRRLRDQVLENAKSHGDRRARRRQEKLLKKKHKKKNKKNKKKKDKKNKKSKKEKENTNENFDLANFIKMW